jgi:hypothetical protein
MLSFDLDIGIFGAKKLARHGEHERVRSRAKERKKRFSQAVAHTYRTWSKKGHKIGAQQVAVMMTPCNTR